MEDLKNRNKQFQQFGKEKHTGGNAMLMPRQSCAAAQPGFDLGEGTAVMDPEIWNRGGSRSPPLSPFQLE